ncbi:hypothetical protein ACNPPY_15565 [Achromobacter sp. AGC78]|uniref:Uncharacterized protein n=1 Tax=Achromobacter spanius TaxID=217203 RepID=A0AA42S847_9BURK|nr:hypothetical protein [Achromobacter spanius]MDH0740306.1 hypothetical protein [Achromobacter spanius]
MPLIVQVMKQSTNRLKAMAMTGECMGDLKIARRAALDEKKAELRKQNQ